MRYRATTTNAGTVGASVPDAHALEYTSPGLTAQAERNSDDLAAYEALPIASQRYYRPGAIPGSLTGNQPANVAGNTEELNAATKLGPGSPNYQANELVTGLPFGPDSMAFSPIPETAINVREDVTPGTMIDPATLQARAGSTSMDNTRASVQQRTYLIRPFDKLISEHPDTIGRVIAPAPFAARPTVYADPINDAFPSAGGHFETAGRGPGVAVMSQPNTVRLLPNEWDETIVNTGGPTAYADPAASAVTVQRRAGWRAR